MAITIQVDEFAESIDSLYESIAKRLPEIMQIRAMDLRAVIKDRIQQRGEDGSGRKMEDYAQSYRKVKAERYGEESVAFRNYTASGNMWQELQITDVEDSPDEVVIVIAGRTADAQKKFNYPSEPDARNPSKVLRDILTATPEEIEVMDELVDEMIQEVITEAGF